MLTASLLISGRDWLAPAGVLLVVALAALWWNYRQEPARGGLKAACAGLKTLGLLALFACLLEPLWTGERVQPGANFIAVVADNSQGMQVRDANASSTRGEELRALLDPNTNPWLTQLGETFQVRKYLFDTRVQSTRDFSELNFDGRATSLGATLRTLAERYEGQPLAGVMLLTDGNATDITGADFDVAGLPPVYPVVIGQPDAGRDVALQKIAVSQTAFEDAPVTIQADAMVTGPGGGSVTARLLEVPRAATSTKAGKLRSNDSQAAASLPASTNAPSVADAPAVRVAGAKLVAESTQRARRSGEPLSFRFQLRPENPGVSFYQVELTSNPDAAAPDAVAAEEVTLANNQRLVVVDRGKGPYRILYVSGRPNWEFKFLNRALEEDDQIELVALIRIAKKEPKFEFRGRRGETANPLFRGFDKVDETTERHDQPVLVRLNTRDDEELRDGFPRTAEDLFQYHAVILDDLEADFFTRDQMTLLQKFASQRGGGFLMLGGQESFNQGNYPHTPVGDMLPVYLDRLGEVRPLANLRLTLTREGWLQPWVRLRDNETAERTRIDTMPMFQVVNRTRDIKPGASVLATVADPGGAQLPALVVQRYGHGRVGALMIGDFWRWAMHRKEEQDDTGKAWRQMMRWLIVDVPGRIAFQAEPKPGDPNHAITLQVRARDAKFEPLDNSSVAITVTPMGEGAGKAIQLLAEPALNEAGLYEATFVPRDTGGYLAEAVVTDGGGLPVGRAEIGWTVDFAADEFRSLVPNRDLLAAIAKRTGGEMIEAGRLERFVGSLPHRKAPITEPWAFPLWHTPVVFLFALMCFVAEWGLRRWKGLA
jgi:uncharacterized membrane protein